MLHYTWIICLWLFDFNACKTVKAQTLNDFHHKQKLTFSFPKEIQKLAATRALKLPEPCKSMDRDCMWVIYPFVSIGIYSAEFRDEVLPKFLRLPNCLHEPITRNPLWQKSGVPNSSFWINICWLTHESLRVFVSWEVSPSLYKVHPFQDCFL